MLKKHLQLNVNFIYKRLASRTSVYSNFSLIAECVRLNNRKITIQKFWYEDSSFN